MKWSLMQLQKYRNEPYQFAQEIDLKESVMAREKEILDMAPVSVHGTLIVNADEVITRLNVSVAVTLPSARSLEPVVYPMNFDIYETYVSKNVAKPEQDSDENIIYLENDVIDLNQAVADGILLHLPLQVFTEEEMLSDELPSGNGWEVISQDDYLARVEEEQENKMDPRLSGLADLLKSDEEQDQ